MILGTAAYMSPEQARGKSVDKRADVWAFGAVVFEMLSGKRPFEGRDVSEVLGSVLRLDPDWDALPDDTPPHLTAYLKRCLEKEPKQRVHDIADVRLAMEGAFETPVAAQTEPAVPQRGAWLPWVAGVAVAVVISLVVWTLTRPEPIPAPDLMRFVIAPSDTTPFGGVSGDNNPDLTISPDGTQIVYSGRGPSGPQLYLQQIGQLAGQPLRGAEGGTGPFFSPNGEWVGFIDSRTLKKVPISGGPPVTLTESPAGVYGASWGTDDQIIFGTAGELFRVPAGGGEPEALTTLNPDEVGHGSPFIIPGREAVVFMVFSGGGGQLAVLDLDTREPTQLGIAGFAPHYVSTGHLVYVAPGGTLHAVPFDAASLRVTGDSVQLAQGVRVKRFGAANFSISDTGRLVYETGEGGSAVDSSPVWVDREGQEEPIMAPLRNYVYPRISPDGTRVAFDIRDEENDVWVLDLATGTLDRLTTHATADLYPHWTIDGQRIVFLSTRDGAPHLYWKAADGTGTAERLSESAIGRVNALTPDGTRVIASTPSSDDGTDLVMVTLDGEHVTETLLGSEFREGNAALSPDGKWLAHQSNETGQGEVYVRPFPDVESGRTQVSTAGGGAPSWAPDGSELFYVDAARNRMMAVSVQTDPTFSHETPQPLFEGNYFVGAGRTYDVGADGRFLMVRSGGQTTEDAPPPQIHVVLDWFQELTERVPIP